MVIRINELKLRIGHSRQELENEICRILRIRSVSECVNGRQVSADIPAYEILHRSIDARKKPDIYWVYTIDVMIAHPQAVAKKLKNCHVTVAEPKVYQFPFDIRMDLRTADGGAAGVFPGSRTGTADRPVVVGSGPAGLFCALMLARAGLCPIVLERGEAVEKRRQTVARFWESGVLNPESNVQFGEGGAGTFSDGKLNTLIRDPDGRIRFVLREFVRAGADPSVLWEHKPHIGTDILIRVVKHIREEILLLGGEFRFEACLTGISDRSSSNAPRYALNINNGEHTLHTNRLVLAIGHSARDTFHMLYAAGFTMEPKAFAVGLRIEHSQAMINRAMYGMENTAKLGAAPYKLTHKCRNGRGVYSFCMCPGGYVVNAASEPGMTAVNGMSYSGRNGENANSAIVVTVTPQDYLNCSEGSSPEPLIGIAFQRQLEQAAWAAASGKIPVQRFADFCRNRPTLSLGRLSPANKGQWQMANLRSILPEELNESLIEGICAFGRKLPGFDDPDALLSGVESRTSSPVRVLRDGDCRSIDFPGIYPCGEGAGYAGGITSAAIDGIRVAEAVCRSVFDRDSCP